MNSVPNAKMAARTHRKGFSSPLPEDGWSPEWGTWEDYYDLCLKMGARDYRGGVAVLWVDDDDKTHRLDGPAYEEKNGMKSWSVHGTKHRENGPAHMVYGHKAWFYNGKLHRLDGPAVERPDGSVDFWKDGIQYTDITFTESVKYQQ